MQWWGAKHGFAAAAAEALRRLLLEAAWRDVMRAVEVEGLRRRAAALLKAAADAAVRVAAAEVRTTLGGHKSEEVQS